MEQQPRGGDPSRLPETPRWPKYLGALALDAWLNRVAALETPAHQPSVELFIALYPGDEVENTSAELCDNHILQLPLHLQWGDMSVPPDPPQTRLTSADAEVARRLLATAVDVLAGRSALFALYEQLEPRA